MEIIVCGDSWESFELLERIKSKRTSLRRLIERYEATWEFHRSEKDGSVNMGTLKEITMFCRAVVTWIPPASTPLKCKIGSEVELYNLVGTEKGWNGRRGVVVGQHLTIHPHMYIRSWALEIACDPPIPKTAFFSDKVRLVRERKRQKKIKPTAPCPCGSGKTYKKCCHKKNARTKAADRTEAREQNRDRSLAAKPASTKSQRQKRAASISDV